jgi:hypothetical protein
MFVFHHEMFKSYLSMWCSKNEFLLPVARHVVILRRAIETMLTAKILKNKRVKLWCVFNMVCSKNRGMFES